MSNNTRATSVLFGFDFQVNAAIALMLENIKDIKKLRIEGELEDIEITLKDDVKIYSQAKSVVKSSSDFRNVIKNMTNSLISLQNASQKASEKSKEIKELIMITNSPNPLNDMDSISTFSLDAHRTYESLSPHLQDKINNIMDKNNISLDLSKFKIQILPFETDDETERYKFIKQYIQEFLSEIDTSYNGITKKLMTIWQREIFKNGTQEKLTYELSKKDVIRPIIVILTESTNISDELRYGFDTPIFNETIKKYSNVIHVCVNKFDFFSQVLFDYNSFIYYGKASEKINCFISDLWKNYTEYFDNIESDDEVRECLIKIILYKIISNRITINKIKEGVQL
ncbi:hypothetical protein NH286_00850 [Anaerococcus sp. NML200574]|uniref:hypothetical protein n=1 Tax=Anaerococcus sp. NML200574 TaxID=2954486 RepID=UPI002238543D|nr:hypothetical protein [Anaerococcus sp. NML200574]MCW6677701.1 hypothetical protein [Anaerococcus sp. NML200574]